MRALRLIGLDADGRSLVCEDSEHGQQYRLPADEQLRAAARGDLTRLGQIEIELESQLRPKEIQARIRAGATVEQVAATAGVPVQRIERYAYPVLLERSRAAEVAQGGHPVRPDGPAVQTLSQIVAAAFVQRSQDVGAAEWDAWRGDDGRWVVQLRWNTGRSDNRAHWRFQPGAHGGTIVALDDAAADLVDPEPTRPLRTVAPVAVVAPAEPELPVERTGSTAVQPTAVVPTAVVPTAVVPTATPPTVKPAPAEPTPVVPTAPDEQDVSEPTAPDEQAAPAPSSPRPRAGRPAMPSWEDVLLGVRSQRG